jgi:hypothetical protein
MVAASHRFFTKELLIVVALWLVGLFFRVYQLQNVMTFSFDQGRDMVELTKIMAGDITLVGPTTGIAGFFLGPFYFYALLPGFILGGGSPVALGYWVALVASLVVPFSYLILKDHTNRWLAIVGALVFAFLPGSINEARVIWNPTLAVPVLVISWWLLFRSKMQAWLLVPSLFLYALSLQTELAYTIFLGPIYLWWIGLHSPFFAKKYQWKVILVAIFAAATTLLPQLLFEAKHGMVMTNSIVAEVTSGKPLPPYTVLWQERPVFLANVLQDQLFGNYRMTRPLFILLLMTLGWVAFKVRKAEHRFLVLASVLPLLGMMAWRGNNGNLFPYYLNPHYLAVCLTVMVAIFLVSHRRWQLMITAFVVGITFGAFYKTALIIYNPNFHQYSYAHQLSAYEYARAQTTSNPPTLEVFVPNLRPVQYTYLNEWYAKKRNVVPAQINSNATGDQNVVLIYEPAFVGGSLMEFRSWYKKHRTDSECQTEQTFGIINVEPCVRKSNQPVKVE